MASEYRRRYAINFDLSVEKIREYYNAEYPQRAYHAIAHYMERHGFEHRQYSGYVSINPISRTELVRLARDIHIELPWLFYCETKMDATVMTHPFDLREMIANEFDTIRESITHDNLDNTLDNISFIDEPKEFNHEMDDLFIDENYEEDEELEI